MLEAGLAIVFAVFSWWFSTGAILFLNQLPKSTFVWSMAAATVIAGFATWMIVSTLESQTPWGAYAGFIGGLTLWGWHELSFLTGMITGPRAGPCPEALTGWRRFKAATATLITHELAIFATLLALLAISYGADNQTALMTFACLWVLRLSAKFNIFLGIPNLTDEFLPSHLDYLKTYFRIRPMNLLFPVSVSIGTAASVALLAPAFQASVTPFDSTAALLVGSLVALGVVEHWLMVLPLPDAALWRWAVLSEHSASNTNLAPAPSRDTGRARQKSFTPEFNSGDGSKKSALTVALMGAKP